MPGWLPPKWRGKWRRPWTVSPRRTSDVRFKRRLRKHGYLSPHFTTRSAGSKDGKAVPRRMRLRAQKHAFKLERVRHRIGDRPITPISWYRSPSHNAAVGGASQSKHLKATATDWPPISALFSAVCRSEFSQGGIGSGAASGRVVHVDNGPNRRWTYPGI